MKPIKTLKQLMKIVDRKGAVMFMRHTKPLPAAFVANWQGFRLHLHMECGDLVEYRRCK